MGLEGSIEEFGLADILQLLYFQKKTGVLTVESRLGRVKIYFHNGDIVGAESKHRLEEKRLGRILVKKGLLTEEDLKQVLSKQRSSGEKFGNVLIKATGITKEQVKDVIVNQLTETIVQLFNWKKGSYEFKPHKVVLDRDLEITVDTQHLLMDGLRIVDEWSVIEGRVTLDAVFRKKEAKGVDLTAEESEIMNHIDGETDVSSIVEISGEEDRDVSRILVSLLDKGVIQAVEEKAYVAESASTRKERSFNIPVLAIITNLLIILSFIVSVGPLLLAKVDARILWAERDLRKVRLAVEREKFETGAYPRSLGPAKDPWGRAFVYRLTPAGYELKSPGPDGIIDTPDDVF